MTAQHAPLPPSSAHIWLVCPGQPAMLRQVTPLPRDDTASREGTAAHWAGAEMLHGRVVAEGQITPEGEVLTREMIESAQVWVDTCQMRQARATTRPVIGSNVLIEQRLDAVLHGDNWGTCDYAQWDVNAQALDAVDFKHGHGVHEVFEHWQLIDYAAMLVRRFGVPDTATVRLTIVQPRAHHRDGPVRTWETTAGALRKYWDTLTLAAEDAASADAPVRVGPHCINCEARHACSALQRDAYRSAQMVAEAVPFDLPPAALGLELAMLTDAADRLKARITGLQAQSEAVLRGGAAVPGWTMEASNPRKTWTRPVAEVVALGQVLGVDLAAPADAVTPVQAVAAIERAARERGLKVDARAVVDGISARPPGALKLARADESLGRRVFG